MDQYLVPRDETARRIDPDGILDAPDSPGAAPQSPSKLSRTSFSGSNTGDEDDIITGSENEEENMDTAAKMVVDKGSEHESSMDEDEGGTIQPHSSSISEGILAILGAGFGPTEPHSQGPDPEPG
jgi:hypothetical protein